MPRPQAKRRTDPCQKYGGVGSNVLGAGTAKEYNRQLIFERKAPS